jgi:hypothetical protein
MGQILLNPDGQRDRLIVRLHPEELIYRPYYISTIDGGKPHPTGDTIGDAIRRVAWRLAWMHAKPKVVDKKFIYGDVEVENGEFVITFYGDLPQVPDDPGPA